MSAGEDEEKELMSDFDDLEIDALVTSKGVEEDTATGDLKRPRPPSSWPPSKVILEDLKQINGSGEEEKEEEEEEDAPKKKKRRLKRKARQELGRTGEEEEEKKKKEASALMDDLFGGEEPSFGEEEPAPKKRVLTLSEDEEKKALPTPPQSPRGGGGAEEETQPEGPVIPVDEERILPGIGGSGEIAEVRCVFADDPNASGWTPLVSTDEKVDAHLQKLPWGVFMRRAHDPKETKGNRWFIVVASERMMRCLGSPFFFCRAGLVRVDGKSVTMGGDEEEMGRPAIYYAYHLLSKEPIWRGAWTPAILLTLLVDTLYAHVEDTCRRRKTHRVAEVVQQALRTVPAFPISHKDPVNAPLPPPQVPLTTASPRKNRRETLKEIWEKPITAKPLVVQRGTVDTSGFAQCQRGFASNTNYLFADLEKPPNTWAILADRGQFDCMTLCEMTHWGRSTVFSVHFMVKQIAEGLGIDPLTLFADEPAGGGGGDVAVTLGGGDGGLRISEERFAQLATLTPLSLDWFASWFDAYFDKSTRDQRLRYYAIFAASEILHDYYEQARTVGPISAGFIFSKWRRERLFESGAHARSPSSAHRLALENITPPKDVPAPDALQDHEQVDVREDVVRFLERLSKESPKLWEEHQLPRSPRPLVLRKGRDGPVMVDKEVDEVGRRLASLAIQMALRWRKLVAAGTPLHSVPPVIVEYAAVYGSPSSADDGLEAFYQSLKGLMAEGTGRSVIDVARDTPEVLLLRPSILGDGMEMKLREAKRQASKKSVIRALVLDSFHLWPVQQLTTLLAAFKEAPAILADATHLIITGRAHSLSETAGGGNYVWDLFEVSERLSQKLGVSRDAMTVASLPALNRFARTQGTLSAQLYAIDVREEQYKFNKERVAAATPAEAIGLICAANRQRGAERSPTVLVLSALQRTQNALKRAWLEADDSMVTGSRASVTFTTYQAFARAPSSFASTYAYVLFADTHYIGKGRFTYHHINAAFERATRTVYALMEKGERGSDALYDLYERFLQSDAKTDSLNMHVGRCNLVVNVYDQLMQTKTIASQFAAD